MKVVCTAFGEFLVKLTFPKILVLNFYIIAVVLDLNLEFPYYFGRHQRFQSYNLAQFAKIDILAEAQFWDLFANPLAATNVSARGQKVLHIRLIDWHT